MIPVIVLLVALLGLFVTRQHRRSHLPAQAVIVSPRHSTVVSDNGAVRSVQSAELTMPPSRLDQLWNPTGIENLARTYWRFLSRVTLGLIRVVYGENERSVVLLARPFTLLRFAAPEYVLEPGHANVRWRIRGGLLVARAGRGSGFLALDARKLDPTQDAAARLRIEVEVANFYPSIAANFSLPVYEATQSSIHVLVTHAFLRSLATLHLAKSKVGRFARWPVGATNPLERPTTPPTTPPTTQTTTPTTTPPTTPTASINGNHPAPNPAPGATAPPEPTAQP